MKHREDHQDTGMIAPAILLVVLAFVAIALAVVQVGFSADRSGRVQVAADAAALAAGQAIAPAGSVTPASAGAAAGGDPRGAAVRYAMRNLPGLEPDGVKVTVAGDRVTVALRDRTRVSTSPITNLRTPDNRASATAEVLERCDDDQATPADPGTGCDSPRFVVRLVE